MKIGKDVEKALISLGMALKEIPAATLRDAEKQNPWFTEENVQKAAMAWSALLNTEAVNNWLSGYAEPVSVKNAGIIMAGNIPFVGLHDLISVVVCGHKPVCRLSSDDTVLMSFCIRVLNESLKVKISVVDKLKDIELVIATGSNNTARIFESYFKQIPRIIRKNRTGIAVLTGHETPEELENLGKDIFSYFGLGCRNISKLFVPEGYDFNLFYESVFGFGNVINHNKYANNYEYNRAIYLLNGEPFLDNNFLMIKQDKINLRSPLSVVFYDTYENLSGLQNTLKENDASIQCVESKINLGHPRQVSFGKAQSPVWKDYADGIDTIDFLVKQ
jgi:hypothetical protein